MKQVIAKKRGEFGEREIRKLTLKQTAVMQRFLFIFYNNTG